MMSFLGGAPFAGDLEAAFGKIQEALPVKSLPYLQRIQELFLARPDPSKDYSRKQDTIAAIIDAILHQRQARIAYFSFNSKKTKTYTLDPYRLVYFRGGLYLYARAHEYGEVRTFAVERIEKIEVMDLNFKSQEAFDATEYVKGAFGIAGGKPEPVELVFDAAMSNYIRERVWHETQEMQEKADGSTVLRMNVFPGWELKSWIKGFLPHVRVVQPAKLRDEIAKELDKATKGFAAKPKSKK
jgi:predicted DNA-binding transcriptional regulator YafY